MMKFWLTTVATIFAVAPAMAADLAAPIYKAPRYQAPAQHDWNGWYAGINGGYSWGPWTSSSGANLFGTGAGSSYTPKGNGWLGGLQIGRNWQNGVWLYGIEADAQITGEKDSNASSGIVSRNVVGVTVTTTSQSVTNEWKMPWFGTLRGRVGVTSNNWLFFGTGGLALGHYKFSNNTATTVAVVGPASFTTVTTVDQSESTTRLGFALGAGVEAALSQHWSVKAEYLYLDFGSRTFLGGTTSATDIRLNDHIVRVGLNYHFGQ